MIFLCSDHHFYHTNIIRYCNRPFDNTHEMNSTMVANHNNLVQPDDIVYFLGDVCFGSRELIGSTVSSLNGMKVLYLGNHDYRFSKLLAPHFAEVSHGQFFEDFHGIANVFICHFPVPHKVTIPDNTEVVLHGHVHNNRHHVYQDGKYFINLSVELWDYSPVSIEKIKSVLERMKAIRHPD
jgi:calcineurin-like phosphoesterase family protein